MKLYYKDKLKIIELYEQGVGAKEISLQFDVVRSTIQDIARLYDKHGLDILKDKKENVDYSVEFKYSLVQRVLSGESYRFLGAEYGIN